MNYGALILKTFRLLTAINLGLALLGFTGMGSPSALPGTVNYLILSTILALPFWGPVLFAKIKGQPNTKNDVADKPEA